MHIEQLDGGKLFEHGSGSQSAGSAFESGFEGDLEAVGQELDKDMGFNAIEPLMINWADREVSFELFEGLLDLGELKIILPHLCRVGSWKVGAQQITSFATPSHPQPGSIDAIA